MNMSESDGKSDGESGNKIDEPSKKKGGVVKMLMVLEMCFAVILFLII